MHAFAPVPALTRLHALLEDFNSSWLLLQELLVLFVVVCLITVKSAWLIVGAWILRKAYKRRYFYPLSCVPEMVALLILLWPGFLGRLTGAEEERRASASVPPGATDGTQKKGKFRFLRRRKKQSAPNTAATTTNEPPQFMSENGSPARTDAGTHTPAGSPASTTDTAVDMHQGPRDPVQSV